MQCRLLAWISLLCLSVNCLLHQIVLASEIAALEFNRDIRPILSENCFQCHGPDSASREADLRVDAEESAKADLGGYSVIVPGEPESSELVRRIVSRDPEEQMPPPEVNKKLKVTEIERLKEWIAAGAPWSPAWAYVPPKWNESPRVQDSSWSRNWIDPFVLARLEQEQLSPNQPADPVTLLRRVSFDLTGLPPSPELLSEYVADPSDANYERVVDQLLASPHFGERMAMMWLDLVRFADTVGYHGDQTHSIWPFRDYVIQSFNENLPFDQFTREQLAGDLIPQPGEDQIIAASYNRLLQTSHEGGVQLKEYRAIYQADRIRNVSQVWMGATVGCAQCHDHKFDPYTSKDFYSLGAFFADIDDEAHLLNTTSGDNNGLPTRRVPEQEVLSSFQRRQLAELDREIDALKSQGKSDNANELLARREKLAAEKSLIMISHAIEPREVRVLARGDWQDETGEVVQPAVPSFLGTAKPSGDRATRLDLANWLTDPEQGTGGLTARVMVNRYWALMFGEGLARVLDEFGGQGEAPSHPELLDNLAVEFSRSGWDTKHVLKLIALSNTYRQSSQVSPQQRDLDPLNRWLAHQNRFRLPAEMVRDTTLAVSGLLDRTVGGRSVRPYQPARYYEHLNYPQREYEPDTGSEQWRRGVYMHWQRTFLHPMLKALDAPTREECTARRPRSNTALAALVLLNDPSSVEAARALASQILLQKVGTDDSARIAKFYEQTVSRLPDDHERQVLLDLLAASREQYSRDTQAATELLAVGNSPCDKSLPPEELAAWSTVARVMLNMSETTTRN